MTPLEVDELKPGDIIEVQLKLDLEVRGRILSVSPNGVYVDWEDMQPTFEPRSKLLRTAWSALENDGVGL